MTLSSMHWTCIVLTVAGSSSNRVKYFLELIMIACL